jgi:hypothetical protein
MQILANIFVVECMPMIDVWSMLMLIKIGAPLGAPIRCSPQLPDQGSRRIDLGVLLASLSSLDQNFCSLFDPKIVVNTLSDFSNLL